MSQLIISKKKAEVISNGIFLIGIGILFWTNFWWPGILLVIWAALATRQYFTGRFFDLAISSLILLGLFTASYFQIDLSHLIPLFFVLGGLYIIIREYYFAEENERDPKD